MDQITISVELGSDWGVDEISDAERDAYAALVLAELSAGYPDHEVEVTHGGLAERVYAESRGEGPEDYDGAVEAEPVEDRDLESEVNGVIQDVWAAGAFWAD